MADYKLPQIIREYKAIEYDKELADKLDSYELIEAGSQEELEIRAATVWVCEIISEELSVSAGLVDRAIWWLGREVKAEHPYHRTYTIFY
jgi:hypothetical protein